MCMKQPFLLFDLDGTISDPLEGIGRSINFALDAYGFPGKSLSDLSQYVGPPLDEIFKSITGKNDPTAIKNLVVKFRERYGRIGYRENKLYPGIKEAMQAIAKRKTKMALCTSKRQDFAEKIVSMFFFHKETG